MLACLLLKAFLQPCSQGFSYSSDGNHTNKRWHLCLRWLWAISGRPCVVPWPNISFLFPPLWPIKWGPCKEPVDWSCAGYHHKSLRATNLCYYQAVAARSMLIPDKKNRLGSILLSTKTPFLLFFCVKNWSKNQLKEKQQWWQVRISQLVKTSGKVFNSNSYWGGFEQIPVESSWVKCSVQLTVRSRSLINVIFWRKGIPKVWITAMDNSENRCYRQRMRLSTYAFGARAETVMERVFNLWRQAESLQWIWSYEFDRAWRSCASCQISSFHLVNLTWIRREIGRDVFNF